LIAVSTLQFFNLSIFVAYAAINCAPKGQLQLARGSALGKQMDRENAPCKGSCFPHLVGCSEDAEATEAMFERERACRRRFGDYCYADLPMEEGSYFD
jgi:hypothetical protein